MSKIKKNKNLASAYCLLIEKLIATLFVFLISPGASANESISARYPQLFYLGTFTETILLERNPHATVYSDFNNQLVLNESGGYYGGDKFPGTTPQDIINSAHGFLENLRSIGDARNLSDAEIKELYYVLIGTSFGLKALKTNVSDINTVEFMRRRLYNKHCWDFSADISQRVASSFVAFIWMNECYQQKKGDIGQASIMLNHLGIISMTSPALKEKAFALGAELGYLTITNPNAETTYFNFDLNSKPNNIIKIANHSAAFAKENKNYKSEYEILKSLKRTAMGSGIKDNIDNVDKRMVELAFNYGNLSFLQKARLRLESHITLILIFLIGLFPLTVFIFRMFSSCKNQANRTVQLNRKAVCIELKKTFKMLVGIEANPSYFFQILRSFWIFLLGSLMTLLVAASTVDLTGIVLP